MVVNRKQPVAPAQPLSRSSSSQPLPTKRHPKPVPVVNSVPVAAASKGKSKSKAKPVAPTKKKKRASVLDRLFLLSLALFSLYAVFTCTPNPLFPSSPPPVPDPPLCRSLTTYRTHLLEPYLLPPLKHSLALTHRLSEPYVAQADAAIRPYLAPVHRVVSTVSPYFRAVVNALNTLWKDFLIPFYYETLLPYYDKAIVPRYVRFIQPHILPLRLKLERYFAHYVSTPIKSQTNSLVGHVHIFYLARVEPYVKLVRPHVVQIWQILHDVTSTAWEFYVANVHPHVVAAWIKSKPLLFAIWGQVKRLTLRSVQEGTILAQRAAKEAGAARRDYVDPHVRKIWEKVAETNASEAVKVTRSIKKQPTPPVQPLAQVEVQEPMADDQPNSSPLQETAESTPTSTLSDKLSSTESIVITEATEIPPRIPDPPTQLADKQEEISVQETVPPSSLHSSSLKAPTHIPLVPIIDVEEELPIDSQAAQPESTSQTLETENKPVAESVDAVPGATVVTGVGATETAGQADDVDSFLEELGEKPVIPVDNKSEQDDFEAEFGDEEEVEYPEPPPPPVLTEEEKKAKLLEETAIRRAEIVARHADWSEKLDALYKEKSDELVRLLQASRNEAAAKIKAYSLKDGELDGVEKEGERLLRGLEGWLKKAESRSVDWKVTPNVEGDADLKKAKETIVEKEKTKFESLSTKVEEKFSDKVNSFREHVHGYYVDTKEAEVPIVLEAGASVKLLAQNAQSDLAMDYAWLHDVTVKDWNRYHKLMERWASFDELSRQIHNGTSTDPAPPTDPVVSALNELQAELQDITLGFTVALNKIRSASRGILTTKVGDADDGFYSVKDGQKRVDDMRGADLGDIKPNREVVDVLKPQEDSAPADTPSISPPPPPPVSDDAAGIDPSKVIIGKDKVQVMEALKDIPVIVKEKAVVEEPEVRHEEL